MLLFVWVGHEIQDWGGGQGTLQEVGNTEGKVTHDKRAEWKRFTNRRNGPGAERGTNLREQWKYQINENKVEKHRYMMLSQGKPFITLYTNFKTTDMFLNCGRSSKNRS